MKTICTLQYRDLDFTLRAERPLVWPEERRASVLRGAFGIILRESACSALCQGGASCRYGAACAYQAVFAPRVPDDATRLSRNQDLPRPFLITPAAAPPIIPAGSEFGFSVRLFGRAVDQAGYVADVFRQLAYRGLGPDRAPCVLAGKLNGSAANALDLTLPASAPPCVLRVRFATPTYLKQDGREVREGLLAFAPLVRRARDRLSALYHFFQAGPGEELPWDFDALGRNAAQATCLADHTTWVSRIRKSTRTGQSHELSGMVGETLWSQVTPEAAHIVTLGSFTGVGKHAAFGLGRISVERGE